MLDCDDDDEHNIFVTVAFLAERSPAGQRRTMGVYVLGAGEGSGRALSASRGSFLCADGLHRAREPDRNANGM